MEGEKMMANLYEERFIVFIFVMKGSIANLESKE